MKHSMLKSTAKVILGTAKTMSKDPTRFHLQLVSVERLEEQDLCAITATDGHSLSHIKLKDEGLYKQLEELQTAQAFLDESELLLLKAQLTAQNKSDRHAIKLVFETPAIKKHEVRYPNYKQFIPAFKKDDYHEVGLSIELLNQLTEAVKSAHADGKPSIKLCFRKEDVRAPILIYPTNNDIGIAEATMVLMPMRV